MAVRQHLINEGCTIPIDVIREALAKAEPSMVAAERERWRAALADALDGLEDMFPYVPAAYAQ